MLSNKQLNILIKEKINKVLFGFPKSDSQKNEFFTNTQQRLTNGEKLEDIFDLVDLFYEGFARVELHEKWNFINTDGELISDQWFDYVDCFFHGFARVKLHEKCNFINTNGEILCDQWFDDAWFYNNSFAKVELNGNYYSLRRDGVLCDEYTKKPLQENKINNINKINMKRNIRLTESDLHNIIKESVKKILKENTNLYDVYQREIISIDPDAERFGPNFEEHPELRETKAYKDAYKYADEMDWYIHGRLHVDYRDINELSFDAERETKIPRKILYQAMIDYLTNELGYDFDNDFDDDEFDDFAYNDFDDDEFDD